MKKKYIQDVLLHKELIISKGKGQRTKKLDSYFVLIANNVFTKLARGIPEFFRHDVYMVGMYDLLKNYHNFNEKKYDDALPFITEVFKRGCAKGYNDLIMNKKSKDSTIPILIRSWVL